MQHAPDPRPSSSPLRLYVPSALALLGLATDAGAQTQVRVTYSIDWHAQTVGDASTSTPSAAITPSDLLAPAGGHPGFGPLAKPAIQVTGGQLGIDAYTGCLGVPQGTPCPNELDALSYGGDSKFTNPASFVTTQPTRLYFSVDKHARGLGTQGHPNVTTQAQVLDAGADVFAAFLVAPLTPPTVLGANTGQFDGNGLSSATGHAYPGLGLIEPNSTSATFADLGDNLDALAFLPLPQPASLVVYFSLDAQFGDPLTGLPNLGSAQAQGFSPSAVLRKSLSGGPPTLYAAPGQLGLDLAGPGQDDLDVLVLAENGDGIYQRSQTPYDWGTDGPGPSATDMLLFSVRRGSQVIGKLDSRFGLPIEPGDLLVPPVAGGSSPFPGIFLSAENLGLRTSRSAPFPPFGDELDAAVASRAPYYDCNLNGVEDEIDIANGASVDTDKNGIPDECEQPAALCHCPAGSSPCGNTDAAAGCANSTGSGGLLASLGSTSYSADDLVLVASQLPAGVSGRFLSSPTSLASPMVLADGLRCVGSPFYRIGPAFSSGAGGTGSIGPGISALACSTLPPAACIEPGTTWTFQTWYRNLGGPCGGGTNLTNALQFVSTP